MKTVDKNEFTMGKIQLVSKMMEFRNTPININNKTMPGLATHSCQTNYVYASGSRLF